MKILGFAVYMIIVAAGVALTEEVSGKNDLSFIMLAGWCVFAFGFAVSDFISGGK